jgi:2-polyprenyl-6-methoxyphenol hydroxylase-like FAD-dependent oxidoreductase
MAPGRFIPGAIFLALASVRSPLLVAAMPLWNWMERPDGVGTPTFPFGSAVVVGGSIAGLLAACVLREHVSRVTIVDRDEMPTEPVHRRAVAHSRHTHGLLARGFEIFEELLPGLGADLVARGALVADLQQDVIWYNDGYKVRRTPTDLPILLVSRPTLESYVRSRVRALPDVRILAGTEATGLRVEGERITGVRVAGPDGATILPASIVVDASGRSNRGPAWLVEHGYPEVSEDVVRANLVYVSREYRRVAQAQDFTGIIHSHYPANPVGSGTLAVDGDRWLVTMLGMNDDVPPAIPGAFEAFAARLAGDELHRLVTTAQPITDPHRFRIGPSVRRRYETCARLPEGFIALGDSLCCFNPAYGQGMTTAAMAALWLRTCLAAGARGLTRRYFRGVRRIIDVPWAITVGNDLRFPHVDGARTRRIRILNAYLPRLHRAASIDPVVGRTFLRVANFLSPPQALISPRILWRVYRRRRLGAGTPPPSTPNPVQPAPVPARARARNG